MPLRPDDIDFEAVALQAPVAWSILDLEGNQVLWNLAYAEMFGYDSSEMSALHVSELTHPDDMEMTRDYLDQLVAGAIDRHETDKRYLRADGSEFVGHLAASLLRDANGTPEAMVGVLTDVTIERTLAEQMARSEDRLSKMLTNISDTLTLVDAEGVVQATSGLHRETLGYPASFWRDRPIFDIVHPDDRARALAMTEEVARTPGEEITAEFRVLHHDGHREYIEVAAVNLLDDPDVRAVVLTTRNLTVRKEEELELRQMRDQAVRVAEQRSNFVANVSHELRTPLHAVLGMAELLAESGLAPEQTTLLDGVRFEAERLRETVDDLLDFVRVEASGIVLEPSAVDVRQLVEELVRRLGATAAAGGVAVSCHISEDVPVAVLLDRHRLDQILTNLLGNAVKFTHEGTVELEVRTVDEQISFVVRDSGPGILLSHRSAIFEPFSQVPGTAAALGGSGLGLALVRGLSELMGGSVKLVEDGPGATFAVDLPMVVASAQHRVAESEVVADLGRSAHVLVVEDNAVNQMLVEQQLGHLGHRVQVVATATEGLELLATPSHGFDIVLMDWQLPDIDGLEATRRLRRMEADLGRHVPVLAVTASAMPEDQDACRLAGMDDFLPKPVTMRDLAAAIARWVPWSDRRRDPRPGGEVLVFDERRLATLVDELESRTIVVSLIGLFLDDLRTRCANIEDAHERGDLDVVRRTGHTLRSASEMLGAMELSAICRRLEAAESIDAVGFLLEAFTSSVDSARTELQRWVSSDDSTAA